MSLLRTRNQVIVRKRPNLDDGYPLVGDGRCASHLWLLTHLANTKTCAQHVI